jgi:hypothetical protein
MPFVQSKASSHAHRNKWLNQFVCWFFVFVGIYSFIYLVVFGVLEMDPSGNSFGCNNGKNFQTVV